MNHFTRIPWLTYLVSVVRYMVDFFGFQAFQPIRCPISVWNYASLLSQAPSVFNISITGKASSGDDPESAAFCRSPVKYQSMPSYLAAWCTHGAVHALHGPGATNTGGFGRPLRIL